MKKSTEEIVYKVLCRYVKTGDTMRNLARYFKKGKSTIHHYIAHLSKDVVPYDLYRAGRTQAKTNKEEVYEFGKSQGQFCAICDEEDLYI